MPLLQTQPCPDTAAPGSPHPCRPPCRMQVPSSLTVRSRTPCLLRVPRYPGGWGRQALDPLFPRPHGLRRRLPLLRHSSRVRARRPVALTHHPLRGVEQPLTSHQSYPAPPGVESDLTRSEAYFVFFWRDVGFFPAPQGCQPQDTFTSSNLRWTLIITPLTYFLSA